MRMSRTMKYSLIIFLLVLIIGSLLFNYWQSFSEGFENGNNHEYYVTTMLDEPETISKVNENGLIYVNESDLNSINLNSQYPIYDIRVRLLDGKTRAVIINNNGKTDRNMNIIPVLKSGETDIFYIARLNENGELEYLTVNANFRNTDFRFTPGREFANKKINRYGKWRIIQNGNNMDIKIVDDDKNELGWKIKNTYIDNGAYVIDLTDVSDENIQLGQDITLRLRDGGFQSLVRLGNSDNVKLVNLSRLRNNTLSSQNKVEDIKNIIENGQDASDEQKKALFDKHDKHPNVMFTAESFPAGGILNDEGYTSVNLYTLIATKEDGVKLKLEEILNSNTTTLSAERQAFAEFMSHKPHKELRAVAYGGYEEDAYPKDEDNTDDNGDNTDDNGDNTDDNGDNTDDNGDNTDDNGDNTDDNGGDNQDDGTKGGTYINYPLLGVDSLKGLDGVLLVGEPANMFAEGSFKHHDKCSKCGCYKDGVSCNCSSENENKKSCTRVLTNNTWL
jgi:hypothetical protein